MSTLILGEVGAAIGGALGGPFGAMLGRAIGALAGGFIDNQIISALTPAQHVKGPRLKDLQVLASTEGAAIPRLYGTARLAGQIIWATRLEEEVRREKSGGGKGGGGQKVKTTTYNYYANFAVGICEGEVARINRVWADGKPLELDELTLRFYPGSETQAPDPLIAAREGASNAPAYRGLAYVVFERLPLERFGNRIPQLTFEVVRPVGDLPGKVRAVDIIPGSGEFYCDPDPVRHVDAPGAEVFENVHADTEASDWRVSMDQLKDTCANIDAAALVVSWFGDDLRCGHCAIRPKVEVNVKANAPHAWKVAGLTRAQAEEVSRIDGRPAFGGTPSDASVIRAIRDMNARGLKPVFYPFIMMDIPAGNALPDPYTDAASQPAYPWRGRITCDPAPGRPGTPDKTTALNSQLNAFIGTAQASDFYLSGDEVIYTGPDEWSYRRFILHYAWLAKAAGNVEAFLIGSELRGLTWLRDGPASYPFVQALRALAADVKSILGPSVKVSYAADWSEWFGHHPSDGSGDLFFHLDDLWADASIDFIGIDNYMPLSDWRDGLDHADAIAGAQSVYDTDYLKSNIAGGEGFDWYYASPADREAQNRTPITDGAYDKPWVWRYKDLKSWWENAHHNRPGGVEDSAPTAWVPRSKPFWFTEAGCPAVDKGANQPNVFYDPKSSESALPYFSNGRRDDAMQRAYMTALLDYWSATGAHNPVSPVYGGPMVEASRIFFWAWDARPYPWFPARGDVWGDVHLHEFGHWLNGRVQAMSVEELLRAICADFGVDFPVEAESMGAVITGYVLDEPMSARAAIEPLAEVFAFDAVESGNGLAFRRRQRRPALELSRDDLAEPDEGPLLEITRADIAELPRAMALSYMEQAADHRVSAVQVRATAAGAIVPAGELKPVRQVRIAAVMPQALAGSRATVMLAAARAAAETIQFALGPDHLALEPGDVISLRLDNGAPRQWRVTRMVDEGLLRRVEAVAHDNLALEPSHYPPRRARTGHRLPPVAPEVVVLDVPLLSDDAHAERPMAAAFARPWRGAAAIARVSGGAANASTLLDAPVVMGELLDALPPARPWVYDRGSAVRVRLFGGQLQSVGEEALLAGANAAAIGDPATATFEIVQFLNAALVGENTWLVSMLLRGQRGSDPELKEHPKGSRFVLLDASAVEQANGFRLADVGQSVALKYGPADRDMSDPTWRDLTVPFAGRGMRPLRPVHLRARRLAGGDVRLEWKRRSRLMDAADVWGLGGVPLGEAAERYRLEIIDPAAPDVVVRAIDTSAPQAVWSAAAQASDFPAGVPPLLTIRVAQVSETYGPGAWLQKEVRL